MSMEIGQKLALAGILLATGGALLAPTANRISWSRGTDPPLPRGGYYAARHGDGLVLAGGTYWKAGEKLWVDRVDYYDPERNEWRQWPSLPRPLAYGAMVAVRDSLYLLGGVGKTSSHRDIYRLSGAKWVRIGETPSSLYYTAAAAVGERIYLLGGGPSITDLDRATNEAWVLNLRDLRWRRLPPIPGSPRVIHTAASFDGDIYLFGGSLKKKRGDPLTNLDDAYRLRTATEQWERLGSTPVAARAWWAEPAGNFLYLFGGYSDRFLDHVYRYDPRNDTYVLISNLPLGLCDTKFLYSRGVFYGISGEDRARSRFPGLLIGRPRRSP